MTASDVARESNDDLVAQLERERLGGMPRWEVRPIRRPQPRRTGKQGLADTPRTTSSPDRPSGESR